MMRAGITLLLVATSCMAAFIVLYVFVLRFETEPIELYQVPHFESKARPISPCNATSEEKLLLCLFNRYAGGARAPSIRAMPIVVMGSDRPQYLYKALSSLCDCVGMRKEHNLVIVSLDFIRNDTVEAISSVLSQKECPFQVRILFNEARKRPTIRGPLQLMTHWWWLMEQLFEEDYLLPEDYDGDVMFLEDDQLVSRDAYVVSSYLVELKNRLSSKFDMWGTALSHDAIPIAQNETNPYEFRFLQHNFPPCPNMGYTFNRTVWYRIREHRVHYWESGFPFIDWDNTIGHLMQRCLIPSVVILPTVSRLRHIGEKGIIPNHIFHKRRYNETILSNLTEFEPNKFSWRTQESPDDLLPCVDGVIPGNQCWRCDECKTCNLPKKKKG